MVLYLIWLGGYHLFTANRDTNVPQRYNAGLGIAQWSEFKNGYNDYVNKKQKESFRTGTYVGVAFGIYFLVVALSYYK